MAVVQSFAPLVGDHADRLILGSMPGKRSLAAGRYYAHPQNAFWPIMGCLFGFDPDAAYEERTAVLKKSGIALWDVMKYCERSSSMDSDIVEESIIPNDIVSLLQRHNEIQSVFFNGAKAEQSFKKYISPVLDDAGMTLSTVRLPSTSPANARISFPEKLQLWRRVLE